MQKSAEKQIQNYKFNLHDIIGRGSYGTVYKGLNVDSNQPVALKVIDKKTLSNDLTWQLISKEIEIMKTIKIENQNVVKLLDVIRTQNNTYIVQEYCSGGDLKSYIYQKKVFTEKEAVEILK